MKLSEAKNLVLDKKSQMTTLEVSLEDAKAARDELTRQLTNARARLKRKKENTKYPTKLAQDLLTSMKKEGFLSNILIEMIDAAAETNVEFERTAYKAALYEVAKQTDIYKLFLRGSGWNMVLSPEIVFEEEAGDLGDWADAIQSYREELEVKIKSNRSHAGFKATQFWAERVFGTGLEVITINARLSYANGLAPFWRILNSGSQPLASDRPDNSFNPIPASPTDFIGDAERAIASEFRRLMQPAKERWLEEVRLLEEEIAQAQEVRDGFNTDLDKITTEQRKNKNALDRMKKRTQYVEEKQLPNAVVELRADEKSEIPKEEETNLNLLQRSARFVGGLFRKAIRGVKGYFLDD